MRYVVGIAFLVAIYTSLQRALAGVADRTSTRLAIEGELEAARAMRSGALSVAVLKRSRSGGAPLCPPHASTVLNARKRFVIRGSRRGQRIART